MKLSKIMEEYKEKCLEEKDFVEILKKPDIELPYSLNEWNLFYENLNDYLIVNNLMDEESPYKNINLILDIIVNKKNLDCEEKAILLKYSVYFSYSNSKIFEDMESSDKVSSFTKYMAYRYNKFVNVYNAVYDLASKEIFKSIIDEIFLAKENKLLTKEQMEMAIVKFNMSYGNSQPFNEFMKAVNEGILMLSIKEEKDAINDILINPYSKEEIIKKRL